jgi:acetyl-CoA acyltransferase
MNAYLVEAKRTAIGRAHPDKGLFREVRADEMLAALMNGLLAGMTTGEELTENIDDIYIGCVGQHLEQGKNIARLSSLLAGLPDSVPGVTINRLCASSLQAFNFAASTITSGNANLLLAGGVEHMAHVPMQAATDYHQELLARYEFPFNNMGLTAVVRSRMPMLWQVTTRQSPLNKPVTSAEKSCRFLLVTRLPSKTSRRDQELTSKVSPH